MTFTPGGYILEMIHGVERTNRSPAPVRIEAMALSRRNSYWLALLAVLTMVLTIGGAPAFAIACGEMSQPSTLASPAQSHGCEEKAAAGHCCCAPSRQSVTGSSVQSGHAETGATTALSLPGCDCAVQAPTATPPSGMKATTQLLAQELLFLPGSPLVLHLPVQAVWAYAVSANGPPRSPVRSSGPSRAPPAC